MMSYISKGEKMWTQLGQMLFHDKPFHYPVSAAFQLHKVNTFGKITGGIYLTQITNGNTSITRKISKL